MTSVVVAEEKTAKQEMMTSSPAPARPPPPLPIKNSKTRPVSAQPAIGRGLNETVVRSYNWDRERLLGLNRCTRCVKVVGVTRTSDNKMVAVRKITSPIPMKCWPEDAHAAYKEVKRLTALPAHPNLASFKALFEGDFEMDARLPQPFVEMELLRKNSLNSLIQKHFELRGAFTARQIASYMQQLAAAVAYLHQNGILHRDIRPKNMFILPDDLLKLADVACPKIYQNRSHASRFTAAFWVAKHGTNGGPDHCCMSSAGSWPYAPPEIMCEFKKRVKDDVHLCDNKLYTAASDVWSMGVVLYEMLVMKVPFAGRIPKQINKSIADAAPLAQLYVPAVRNYPAEIINLVNRMILKETAERIKVKELEQTLKRQVQKIDLMQAATEGDLAKVRQLVAKDRADVNDADAQGYTALMRAAEMGHVDVVQYLLDQRADLAMKTRSGATALDWAKDDKVRDAIESAKTNQAQQIGAPRIRNY